MLPSPRVIQELRRDDIAQARSMTPEQRLLAGGDLFDDACQVTLWGIKAQHPGISDTDAHLELRRRVRSGERRESRR
jgi:hypothetical protein